MNGKGATNNKKILPLTIWGRSSFYYIFKNVFPCYVYDYPGRLTNVYDGNLVSHSYTYDGDNLRQTKTINGNTTTFILDGMDVAIESGSQNTITYLRGMGLEGYLKNGTSRKYYYNEPNGSTYIVYGYESNNYEPVGEYAYGGFGNLIWDNWQETSFAYAGEYHDDETGFIYLRNRYYDPNTGRFISEDPAMDGLNWYAYCNNNPVNFVDPWGLTITLTGTEDEMEKSFNQLQALTNDKLIYDKKTGVVTIVSKDTANTNKTLNAGTKMISDLIFNDSFSVSIERIYSENEGCYVWYDDDGATIQMNNWAESSNNWGYMVSDGKGGSIWENHADVAHIVLGHELIHATHYMNGTIANPSRTVYRYTSVGLMADIRDDWNISEEYNTVGLYHIVEFPSNNSGAMIRRFYIPWPGSLTENTLRAEHGLTNRIAY